MKNITGDDKGEVRYNMSCNLGAHWSLYANNNHGDDDDDDDNDDDDDYL